MDASDDEVWDALRAVRLDEKISGLPEGLDTPVGSTSLSGGNSSYTNATVSVGQSRIVTATGL